MNFFDRIYGDDKGYVFIVTRDPDTGQLSQSRSMRWPRDKAFTTRYVGLRSNEDVYFSVSLFTQGESRSSTDGGATVRCIWADADTCDPTNFLLEPTLQIETSPGRWHCLWLLDEPVESSYAQEVSRAIAYKHRDQGCDVSGWTSSKILRVPGTVNTKYDPPTDVVIRKDTEYVYRLEEIEAVYPITGLESTILKDLGDMPKDEAFDPEEIERLEEEYILDSGLSDLYLEEPVGVSWSERMRKLELELFRQGADANEVFKLMWLARCNKFNPDNVSEDSVTETGVPIPKRRNGWATTWTDVSKAYAFYLADKDVIMPEDVLTNTEYKDLLSIDERRFLVDHPNFIDDYVSWALSRSPDHSSIFSYSLAWQVLSCAYADKVTYDLRWGPKHPNLWTFIGAGSTRNHKSTANALFLEVIEELEIRTGEKILVANDFSPEKLITTLGGRDGCVSLIDIDEVQGWFKNVAVTKYRSGTYSTLSTLYDGKVPLVLRATEGRGNEEKARTVLNFVGLGILDQISTALVHEDFTSGFMLRSTWAVAEAPPYKRGDGDIESSEELLDVDTTPFFEMMSTLEDSMTQGDRSSPVLLRWTEEARLRLNQFTHDVTMYGISLGNELITPYAERLRDHVAAAACLLAFHEQRPRIGVNEVIAAIAQGERWLRSFEKLVSLVSNSDFGKKCDELESFIAGGRDGKRLESEIFNKFKFRLKEFEEIKTTLHKSGRIRRVEGEKQTWQCLS